MKLFHSIFIPSGIERLTAFFTWLILSTFLDESLINFGFSHWLIRFTSGLLLMLLILSTWPWGREEEEKEEEEDAIR